MSNPEDKDIPEPDSVDLDDSEQSEYTTQPDDFPDSDSNADEESDSSQLNELADRTDEISDNLAETTTAVVGGVGRVGTVLTKTAGKTASNVVDLMPMSWKLYQKLNHWSLWKMQKAAGADAVANVNHPNGREDIAPAKMVRDDDTEKNRGGWKILGEGDKRYDPSIIGGQSNRIGKADIIHINSDDLEQGTWAETAMDAAIATNREQYLFHDAQLHMTIDARGVEDPTELNYPGRPAQVPGSTADDGDETAADGGFRQQIMDVSIERPGVCQDMLVPLQSRTGYDGQLVSWMSYQKLKQEQGDQDQIREAKNRAWAGAMLDQIKQRDLFKLALIGAAILAMALFHADIGAAISSFGSGGGGGGVASDVPGLGFFLIPFMPWGRR